MPNVIMDTIDDAYLDLCISGQLDKAPYKIKLRNNFDTACWSFVKGAHYVFIGDSILKKCKKGIEDFSEYIVSYLYHEVAHSLYTEKDLKMISDILGFNKIPFSMFNLAEDARIEHIMREKASREFKWVDYEEVCIDSMLTPVDQLFMIIQQDGESTELRDTPHLEKVKDFYNQFCEAENSLDLIEILIQWMKEFKDTQEQSQDLQEKLENAKDGSGDSQATRALEDLKESLELQEDEKKLMQFIQESKSIVGDEEKHTSVSDDINNEIEINTTSITKHSTGNLLSSISSEWDVELAQELSERLNHAFLQKSRFKNTRKQSNQVNKKAFRLGATTNKYFRKKTSEVVTKRKINLILDCSGSMYGLPMENMRIVIGVFNELCKKNYIEGKVILSAVQGGEAKHETFSFPLADEVIGKFQGAYGAEGIESTMKANLGLLQDSDLVFILTDGNISDQEIDKEYYHREGLYTVGIYIGNPEHCKLNKWFDKGVAVEKIQHCVEELIYYIKG